MNAIDSLSDYCGIVGSFVDARGVIQTATQETREALLVVMGIQARDEASARRALVELQAAEAAAYLPPVHVHYQAAGALRIKTGVPLTATQLSWRIELEDGARLQGVLQGRGAANQGEPASSSRWYIQVEEQLPCGYHTIILETDNAQCSLIVTPGRCWLPDGLETGQQLWGIAAQLFLLRSKANWGIGDYGDLRRLVQVLTACGADVVGLNPLHAMFTDDPEQASPYSPASRLLLNVLNIDVAEVAASMNCQAAREQMESLEFEKSLAGCREASVVDYSGVTALKLPLLRKLFECCAHDSQDWRSFVAFRFAAGPAFERSCLFLALREHFALKLTGPADWHRWPEDYQLADSAATRRFAQTHSEAVTFQAWLQFIADRQLRACKKQCAGMAVGLYRDLAVGAALGGAETWANPEAVIDSVHVGAPPDIYNPQGQDWGLPPFDPRALRAEGYRSFIDLLRANMRHAGGLRIDHVMALQQLYWVPQGRQPSQGAYVRYPLDDLVGILALESHRHRCLVVGEDLGTVPEGFRERMERARILSYRVMFFEKIEGEFIAAEEYPRLALAVAGSHDMPTLRGWWQGRDLSLKERLHLYPTESQAAAAAAERELDREALSQLLRDCGLVGTGEIDAEKFVGGAHRFLARSHSAITLLQLDDLTGEVLPVNVPTTSREHPNWRRRSSVGLEQLVEDPRFAQAVRELRTQRGPAPFP